MNIIELKEVMKEQSVVRLEQDLIMRTAWNRLIELNENPFVIVISGLRRSGKSTLLSQLRHEVDGHYLNFDDDRLIEFEVSDFQSMYELFIEMFGDKNVFYFDEIQNVKGWELFVRRLRDNGKKVYVTGSNASMLSRELGTHLTGRYLQLTLFPFSFIEFLKFKRVELEKNTLYVTSERSRIKKLFNEYMKVGGIPEYLRTENKEYLKTLYENVLYRDVFVRYKLASEKPMKELVHFISSNVGKEVSFNSLKKTLGFGSSTTVKEYFDYLENSYLVFLVPKFSASLKKQIYANKKVYMVDTGLALNVGYRLSKDSGRLFENLVFLELKRRRKEIYYHREKGECDFVAKGEKWEAIQVCYNLDKMNKQREIDGLVEAMKTLRINKGLLLTYDQEDEIKLGRRKIVVRPVWKWLLE